MKDSNTTGFKNNPFAELLKDWRPKAAPAKPTAQRQAFNSDSPQLLQLRLTLDMEGQTWEAYCGAAGAGKYLNRFSGTLPSTFGRYSASQLRLRALNEAAEKALRRFKGARIVKIEFDGENVSAPIARLELGRLAQWQA